MKNQELKNIDQLLSLYYEGKADKTTYDQLKAWAKESPENREYLRTQLELWFSSAATRDTIDFQSDLAYARFVKRRGLGQKPKEERQVPKTESKKVIPFSRILYRVAVVVLLLVLPLAGYYTGKQETMPALADVEIEAPVGSSTKLTLPDGSLVWLSSGSKLSYSQNFGVKDRNVKIDGEGFFDVCRKEGMTFTIQTKELNLCVLGTKFQFSNFSKDQKARVFLKEGRVALHSNMQSESDTLFMMPNEIATLNKKTGNLKKVKYVIDTAFNVKDNEIFFNEEKLVVIASILSKVYNVQIEVEDSIKDSRFYGSFYIDKGPVEEVLRQIASTKKMKFTYRNHKYLLY